MSQQQRKAELLGVPERVALGGAKAGARAVAGRLLLQARLLEQRVRQLASSQALEGARMVSTLRVASMLRLRAALLRRPLAPSYLPLPLPPPPQPEEMTGRQSAARVRKGAEVTKRWIPDAEVPELTREKAEWLLDDDPGLVNADTPTFVAVSRLLAVAESRVRAEREDPKPLSASEILVLASKRDVKNALRKTPRAQVSQDSRYQAFTKARLLYPHSHVHQHAFYMLCQAVVVRMERGSRYYVVPLGERTADQNTPMRSKVVSVSPERLVLNMGSGTGPNVTNRPRGDASWSMAPGVWSTEARPTLLPFPLSQLEERELFALAVLKVSETGTYIGTLKHQLVILPVEGQVPLDGPARAMYVQDAQNRVAMLSDYLAMETSRYGNRHVLVGSKAKAVRARPPVRCYYAAGARSQLQLNLAPRPGDGAPFPLYYLQDYYRGLRRGTLPFLPKTQQEYVDPFPPVEYVIERVRHFLQAPRATPPPVAPMRLSEVAQSTLAAALRWTAYRLSEQVSRAQGVWMALSAQLEFPDWERVLEAVNPEEERVMAGLVEWGWATRTGRKSIRLSLDHVTQRLSELYVLQQLPLEAEVMAREARRRDLVLATAAAYARLKDKPALAELVEQLQPLEMEGAEAVVKRGAVPRPQSKPWLREQAHGGDYAVPLSRVSEALGLEHHDAADALVIQTQVRVPHPPHFTLVLPAAPGRLQPRSEALQLALEWGWGAFHEERYLFSVRSMHDHLREAARAVARERPFEKEDEVPIRWLCPTDQCPNSFLGRDEWSLCDECPPDASGHRVPLLPYRAHAPDGEETRRVIYDKYRQFSLLFAQLEDYRFAF